MSRYELLVCFDEDCRVREFQDLSFEAKGLLITLWTMGEEEIYRDDLLICSGWGEERLKRITDELQAVGYLFFSRFKHGGKFRSVWLVSNHPRIRSEFLNSRTYQEIISADEESMDLQVKTAISPLKTENPESRDVIIISSCKPIEEDKNKSKENDNPEIPDLHARLKNKGSTRKVLDHNNPAYIYAVLQLEEIKHGPVANVQKCRRDTPEKEELYLQKQAVHFDLLLRRDGVTIQQMEKVLTWLYQGQGPSATFWRSIILCGAKFRERFWELYDRMNLEEGTSPTVPQDPNPEVTKKIIGVFRQLTNNPSFKPNADQLAKFIEGSAKCVKFFKRYPDCDQDEQIGLLCRCLDKNYLNVGHVIYPGHLSNDMTWTILMPQYLAESGY